jgi:hypothetical protein
LPETILDAAESVSSADFVGVNAAHAPVELAEGAAVDLLAFGKCQPCFVALVWSVEICTQAPAVLVADEEIAFNARSAS